MKTIARSILFPSLAALSSTSLLAALACTALAAFTHSAKAAPGDLDLTFGGTGRVTTPIGSGNDYGRSVAIQNDGKIVVAGVAENNFSPPYHDFAVVRYNTNGSLDTSFNGTGKAITDFGNGRADSAYSVALQSDGRIVVAGYSENDGFPRFALARYNPNGSLDTSFNGTGKVTTAIGSNGARANSVAIQSDEKIVVAGTNGAGGLALVRYNSNGSLDTSFNGTGFPNPPVGYYMTATSVGVQRSLLRGMPPMAVASPVLA